MQELGQGFVAQADAAVAQQGLEALQVQRDGRLFGLSEDQATVGDFQLAGADEVGDRRSCGGVGTHEMIFDFRFLIFDFRFSIFDF